MLFDWFKNIYTITLYQQLQTSNTSWPHGSDQNEKLNLKMKQR